MNDPIVDEVRHHRMEHTRAFGGDLNLIFEDLRRIQRVSGYEVVRRPPKLLTRPGQITGEPPGAPSSLISPGHRPGERSRPNP